MWYCSVDTKIETGINIEIQNRKFLDITNNLWIGKIWKTNNINFQTNCKFRLLVKTRHSFLTPLISVTIQRKKLVWSNRRHVNCVRIWKKLKNGSRFKLILTDLWIYRSRCSNLKGFFSNSGCWITHYFVL